MSIVILRQKRHENCSRNMIGLIINPKVQPDEKYDVYCFDENGNFTKMNQAVTQLQSNNIIQIVL